MRAADGCPQLKKFDKFVQMRKTNFDCFYDRLKKYEKYFVLPKASRNPEPSWFGFPILVKKEAPSWKGRYCELFRKKQNCYSNAFWWEFDQTTCV